MSHNKNQIVCITGASSGIGKAAAEIFAEHGYRLALGARRVDRLEEFAVDLKKRSATDVFVSALDVREDETVHAFTTAVKEHFQNRLDVLVNNAGLAAGKDPVVSGKMTDWKTMVDTNILGLVRVSQAFLPILIAQNSGHIINIGSIAGHEAYEGGSVYCGSKAAVTSINKALRLELSGTAIRVTSVDPGMVHTEFSLIRLGDAEKAADVYQNTRPLQARDVAECIYFAVSRPSHVNIEQMLVMPTDQASATKVFRRSRATVST